LSRPTSSSIDTSRSVSGCPGRGVTVMPNSPTFSFELCRAETAGEDFDFLNGLQSNLGKSNQLANGQGYHGDPGHFRVEYAKRRAVTPDSVKRVATKYLSGGRVVLSVVPLGKADEASKPGEGQKVGGETR
jgi:hypothetical protein